MGFLSSFEADLDFDLVAGGQEFFRLLLPHLYIMIIGSKSDSKPFDLSFFLLGFLLLGFLGFLILVFPEIHYLHDRRTSIGNNLNEIQLFGFRHIKSLLGLNNSNLLSIFINEPHLRYADVFVYADSGPLVLWPRAEVSSSYGFWC